MRIGLLILTIGFSVLTARAQDPGSLKSDSLPAKFYILERVLRNGESLPEVNIEEVTVTHRMSLTERFQYWRYQRLIINVRTVYPYSKIVRDKLSEVNSELEKMPEDVSRRAYLKSIEKDVFKEYEDDMKELTITQGRILIKLIDRETANTSYELIQDYRGKVSAVFWQGIARIFGTNLKDKYDPSGDDFIIERIIMEIEAGRL